jgi:hypothetical protein
MKKGNGVLLFLVSAGMELCYLYACTNLVTATVLRRIFPFPEAVASFLAAALLTLFAAGRGWRVIAVLGLQSLGFVPALFRMVSIFSSWSDSFLTQTWLTDFFTSPSSSIEYSIFVLIILWALVFWAGGVGLANRPKDYSTLCSRFDRGLVAFFVLFFAKFYLQTGLGIRVEEPMSGFLIVPFLIFSLLAIGLVRHQSATQRDYLPGFKAIGIMLGFIVVVLLVGTGVVFFWLPYLTLAAEQGNDLLYLISGPIISVAWMVIHWIFGTDLTPGEQLPIKKEPLPTTTSPWNIPAWLEPIGRALTVAVGILVGLVLLAILIGLLYAIVIWLFSKTSTDPEKQSPGDFLAWLAGRLRVFLSSFRRGAARKVKRYGDATRLYAALRTWGSRSGLPHFLSETPAEYGVRLKNRFPVFESEIESIVQSFNREVYGEVRLSEQQAATARIAWRELSNPRHWPMRIKAWFVRSPGISGTPPVGT